MKLVWKSPNEPPGEAGKDLCVEIVSEEAAMARRVGAILKPLELNGREEGRLIHQLWHPEFLIFNQLRELAAVAAAAADIIVIGVHGGRELPGMVHLWMKRWLELRQGRPGALVAVLDSGLDTPDAPPGILPQLRAAAVGAHLDFFASSGQGREGRGKVRLAGAVGATRQFAVAHGQSRRNLDYRAAGEFPGCLASAGCRRGPQAGRA